MATKTEPIQKELKDLRERVEDSNVRGHRSASKVTLVTLIRIVWRLANRVDALERKA